MCLCLRDPLARAQAFGLGHDPATKQKKLSYSYMYPTCTLINLFFSPEVQKISTNRSQTMQEYFTRRFKNWYPLDLTPYKKDHFIAQSSHLCKFMQINTKQYKSRRKIDLIPFAFWLCMQHWKQLNSNSFFATKNHKHVCILAGCNLHDLIMHKKKRENNNTNNNSNNSNNSNNNNSKQQGRWSIHLSSWKVSKTNEFSLNNH